MNITNQRHWLLVATCLLVSACTTEETIIREVPASTEATASDADELAPLSVTNSNELLLQTDTQIVDSVVDPAAPGTEAQTTTTAMVVEAIDTRPTTSQATTVQASTESPLVTVAPVAAIESTVQPNMVDGIQGTVTSLNPTAVQTSGATATPADQMADLFFDATTPASGTQAEAVTAAGIDTTATTDIVTGTQTATGTTTGTTTGIIAETVTGTTTGPVIAAPAIAPPTTDLLAQTDPASPMAIGTPGMNVNCELTVPCRWISGDTHFAVTVSNADNIGNQDRLSIEYSVLTSHDTEVLISGTEPAVDANGQTFEPTALQLGAGIGRVAQGVMAGQDLTARIEFDQSSSANNLSLWTIGLSDSGLIRQPSFSNLPIGSATTQFAECANTLPCAWISPDGNTKITLLSVTGTGASNRLATSFKVETTTDKVVAVDSGATAVGTDGLMYRGRTHSLGTATGGEKLIGNAPAGGQIAGTIFFFITQSMSATLQNLSLIIYEDNPVPRWNPNFLSVPVQ